MQQLKPNPYRNSLFEVFSPKSTSDLQKTERVESKNDLDSEVSKLIPRSKEKSTGHQTQKLAITVAGLKMLSALRSELENGESKIQNPSVIESKPKVAEKQTQALNSPPSKAFKREVFLKRKFSTITGPYKKAGIADVATKQSSGQQLGQLSPRLSSLSGLSQLELKQVSGKSGTKDAYYTPRARDIKGPLLGPKASPLVEFSRELLLSSRKGTVPRIALHTSGLSRSGSYRTPDTSRVYEEVALRTVKMNLGVLSPQVLTAKLAKVDFRLKSFQNSFEGLTRSVKRKAEIKSTNRTDPEEFGKEFKSLAHRMREDRHFIDSCTRSKELIMTKRMEHLKAHIEQRKPTFQGSPSSPANSIQMSRKGTKQQKSMRLLKMIVEDISRVMPATSTDDPRGLVSEDSMLQAQLGLSPHRYSFKMKSN